MKNARLVFRATLTAALMAAQQAAGAYQPIIEFHVSGSGAGGHYINFNNGQWVGPNNAGGGEVQTGPSAPVNLMPVGWAISDANATDGTYQVGYAAQTSNSSAQPILWSGTAVSAVNLIPSGASSGNALDVNHGQVVGYTNQGAELWSIPSLTAVSLRPTNLTGYTISEAMGTDGTHQVGYAAGTATGGTGLTNDHAMMWSGSSSTAVDLEPSNLPGITNSWAVGVGGGVIVGAGNITPSGYPTRALMWTGSAASAIDLTPTNLAQFVSFRALATNGRQEVGFGSDSNGFTEHAMVWSGSADSVVDLTSLLPLQTSFSSADAIDGNGVIYGWAEVSGGFDAVEWVPVPEPTSVSLLGICSLALLSRRRSR